MNRNVWLLFCCQALMNSVMIGQVAMASLIGHSLAVDPALNTLPMAIQMAGTMASSIPASMIFARFGRRPGFLMGCAGSVVGCLGFALGVYEANFTLYCLAALPAGMGYGVAQHMRFAAAELVTPAQRPRAIALVMTGPVLAALIGPEIVKHTQGLVPGITFLATYFSLTALPILSAILLGFAALPTADYQRPPPLPLSEILSRPTFIVAAVAGMTAFGTMNLLMASTPLQMMLCGYSVNDSSDIIRWHVIGMYLPGFVTGRLIQRFGTHRVMMAGACLIVGCPAINLTFGPFYATFLASMVVLGIGWNFMFVGATSLLATSHTMAERVRVQATNDFIVFGTVAVSALMSGVVHATFGWNALNYTVVLPLAIATGLVAWHYFYRHRAAQTVSA